MKNIKKINIKEMIWLFLLGGFLGFILETLWHYIKYGEYINKQGLLYSPFKPIYGLGLIIIILLMNKYKKKSFLFKFSLGTFIGSFFEYFCSIFQEYIFNTSTWDYSNLNLNISGRIYLPYCIAWGLIAVLCLDFIYPIFQKYYNKIPKKLKSFLTIFISIYLIFDITLTIIATMRYAKRTNNFNKANQVINLIDKIYSDEYMKRKFPKLNIITKN